MNGGPAYARIKRDILALAARVPAGYVVTHKQIAAHLKVSPQHIANVVTSLDDTDRTSIPWWRIVADGGAIGRHSHRDEQFQRLIAEGNALSPVGIVQDLAARRVPDLANPPGEPRKSEPTLKPSRSRGMLGKPQSSL